MTRLLLINKITYSHILLLYISFYKQVNDYFSYSQVIFKINL